LARRGRKQAKTVEGYFSVRDLEKFQHCCNPAAIEH
jgi:hypothetical protein